MSDAKQVKVDNWGIFFLQRLKHFFNRTDYCDLTLQFQDNAQLKVHRLVLSACTEYFELLERTCEMYEDCLVMPDDLQADVVVPIVNFMYTGQLEFRMDLLERLCQTSLVMNMPVLTKLLEAHRTSQLSRVNTPHTYTPKRYSKSYETPHNYASSIASSSNATNNNNKRSYSKAFDNVTSFQKYKKPGTKPDSELADVMPTIPIEYQPASILPKKHYLAEPRPTRYELPEELEADNLFDNSFTNISYTSKPLMVHPETTKRYPSKRAGIFEDPSTSKRFIHGHSTMEIVECKKISISEQTYDEEHTESICDDQDVYQQPTMPVKSEQRDSNKLFDQILDGSPKIQIETKDMKQASNLDHAKIISEVLKKYPHLVKSNKSIKLKILNTPSKKKTSVKQQQFENEKQVKSKSKSPDYAYESEVIDSKEAAKLIALGAENIKGPWICLICGTPGKAIHFSSYHKFRRHLVEVHNEKPVLNICEYCGLKSAKRNYLLHHLYTKHGVEPPASYHFPKCNICNYIALTEGFLIKHKLTHTENQTFRCNVCPSTFSTSNQLLVHIQKTGHKYCADRKGVNLQCIYCLKTFLREANLYTHLRTHHKESAKNDGIIDISDDEGTEVKENSNPPVKHPKQEVVKYEVPVAYENEFEYDADTQYQIQQQPDGNIQVVSRKPRILLPTMKHKILNSGFSTPTSKVVQQSAIPQNSTIIQNEFIHHPNIPVNNSSEEIVMIDDNEYVVKDNQLIPKKERSMVCEDYSMSDIIQSDMEGTAHNIIPSSSAEFTHHHSNSEDHKNMIINKSGNMNQPIQIVVSNEEEYKALMANNHSIIFEDGDTSKTLTVLSGPHDNNTTIDLNHTQSNDMMIIPENYPLNVSETVSGNNSNIVVVYSHPVDDQSKEYQLISSQNLEAQFVTSSAMITQNYETVTTSAPLINAQGIETPEHSWPNSISQNMNLDTRMAIPLSNNQVTITPIENEQGSIAHLEEVHLPPMHSDIVQIHSDENINQNTENISIDESQKISNVTETITIHDTETNVTTIVFEEPINSIPASNVNIDTNDTSVDDMRNKDQTCEDINNDSESIQDDIHPEDMSVAEEVEAESSPVPQEKYIHNMISKESIGSEAVDNTAKAIEPSAAMSDPIPDDTKPQKTDVDDPINKGEVSLIKAKEQIESLTSEWSDDEIEPLTQEQSTSQESSNLEKVAECEPMETNSPLELEESIENIQQEMEKHTSQSTQALTIPQPVEPSPETENINIALQEKKIIESEPAVDKAEVINENKTPDKISSLLNDWEENDSQEEDVAEKEVADVGENDEKSGSVNHDSVTNQYVETSNCTEVIEEPVPNQATLDNKPESKTGESIQRLVSDWAEDEEEEAESK